MPPFSTWSMVSTKCIFIALRRFSGDFRQIFLIVLGQNHFEQPGAMSGQQLFFQSADREHFAAQRDLAGHGQVAPHRNLAERAGNRRSDRDAGRRAIFRDRALGHVHVDVEIAIEVARQSQADARASARTTWPACADSCMTSPSLPVRVSLPLPSTTVASVLRIEPPTSGPGQSGDQADFALLVGQRVAELDHAQEVVDVLAE